MPKIVVKAAGRSFSVSAVNVGFFRKGIGLMFRTKETKNLLFSFRYPQRPAITSWFVFFDFFAVWLDKRYNVVEVQRVNPFVMALKPKKEASFLLEVPVNFSNKDLISFLVGK